MKFSLRTLLAIVFAFAILATTWTWYVRVPPDHFGAWENSATKLADDGTVAVPRFYFGTFEAGGECFSGYLIRVDDPELEYPDKPWLETDGGCVNIIGQRILPQSEFQLFVSSNDEAPARIWLGSDDTMRFRSIRGGVADWEQFWLDMLAK